MITYTQTPNHWQALGLELLDMIQIQYIHHVQFQYHGVETGVLHSSPTISYGGAKYYVLFVDEFSRKVWVYVIKRKDDVFNIFKQFRVNGGKKNWQDNQVFKDG